MVLFSTKNVQLDEENKKALHNYQYKGGDNGISYKYFHSPVAEFFVKFVPGWVAPNVITFAGALCLVIPHIVSLVLYGPAFEGETEQWAALTVGIMHMAYITLDNMDGKHARNTKNSSPLGQMFDHGCDAITFSLAVFTLARYRQIGSGYLTFVFAILAPTGYFMYNIKEFYMGEYYLPIINPVSEGSLLEFFFSAYCASFHWEEWSKPIIFGLNRGQAYAAFFVIFQIYQNIEMMFEIINAKKYERKFENKKFYIQFSSYFLLVALCIVATFVSPNDIIHHPIEGGRSIIYIIIFGSSYLVLHLMFGHLANKEFYPYSTPPFVISIFSIVGGIVASIFCPEIFGTYEFYFWYIIAAYLLINSLTCFCSIIVSMENCFGIKAFKVKPKEKTQ
ncbi:unnamed protein product [Moneuplotes crassus]|uniref:CDP-alcohol phosphatidyltransferase n=1 Tax=Euplotes crassus TaxID=5936 RepID=A0AAD1XFM6_EUPCR|nr:unnamed protein product [Moneuplotes crassus]